MTRILHSRQSLGPRSDAAGFSLIELIVAMVVFLIIGSASLTLFQRHEALLGQEQGIAGLNIGLRNALSQLQLDVVNAGYGLILGANVPAWPVGVTIVNSNPTASQCYTAATFNAAGVMTSNPSYTAACFDQLNIIMVDQSTPAIQPTNSCSSPLTVTSATSVTASPASGYYANNIYTHYLNNDQVLFVNSTGTTYAVGRLTAAGTCPSCTSTTGNVSLNFTSGWTANHAYSAGQQIIDSNGNFQLVTNAGTSGGSAPSWSTATGTNTTDGSVIWQYNTNTDLGTTFCSTDWILRLVPINYSVTVTTGAGNYTDPQLVRTQAGVSSVVMDQVIGFKVGAATWDSAQSYINFQYDYLSTDYGNNFSLVRSVRASLIGRTIPSTDPLYTYENPFDNGHYQVRGSSIVVDPRNLTMNND